MAIYHAKEPLSKEESTKYALASSSTLIQLLGTFTRNFRMEVACKDSLQFEGLLVEAYRRSLATENSLAIYCKRVQVERDQERIRSQYHHIAPAWPQHRCLFTGLSAGVRSKEDFATLCTETPPYLLSEQLGYLKSGTPA